MLKSVIRILIILAVITLVAGGIYLLVQKSGTSLLANTQVDGGFRDRSGTLPQGGLRPADGDFNRGGESSGFASRSLAELGVNFGKVALITIGVVLIQGLNRFFRRRKNSADPSAV
jgi:hypothetical protein